jgi:transcriptional regulator with XRE-family HTH domain
MKHASSLKQQRRDAGVWLKGLREAAGLTQMELAGRVGIKYYAFVSQVETGFTRLPTEKIEAWARALGTDPAWFAKRLLAYYEPGLHRVLYPVRHHEDCG